LVSRLAKSGGLCAVAVRMCAEMPRLFSRAAPRWDLALDDGLMPRDQGRNEFLTKARKISVNGAPTGAHKRFLTP